MLRAGVSLATIGVAVAIYLVSSAVPLPSKAEIKKYLESNQLKVGSEIVNDFQHVYYDLGSARVFVTEGDSNNTGAVASDHLIAWTKTNYGDNQRLVFIYDTFNRTTEQLTFYGNAANLDGSGGRLVWTDSSSGTSKIFFYDGGKITLVSDEKNVVRPVIDDNQIAYARHNGSDRYEVVLYNIDTNTSEIVKTGNTSNTWPRFEGNQLIIGGPY